MTKILFAINKLGIGGAESVIVNQVNLIDKEKYDVFLGILYSTQKTTTFYHKLKLDDGKIKHFNFNKFFDLRAFLRVYKYLKDNKINVIVSSLFEANTIFRFAGLLAGVSVMISSEQSCYYNKSWWQKKVDWFLSFFTDCIIGVSQEVVNFTSEQENISIKKFKVLNQISDFSLKGIFDQDMLRKKFRIPSEAFVAITVGRLSPEKAQYRIIECADYIVNKKHIKDIYFLIVGYGVLKDDLIRKIKNKNLDKYVKVIVDPTRAKEYLVAGDIFLLTSDREGMPVAMLEAMHAGLPSIAFNVGGVGDVLSDKSGFLIEQGDTKNMIEKIIWTKNNPKELSKMSSVARAAAIKNSGDIKELENIIDECIRQ